MLRIGIVFGVGGLGCVARYLVGVGANAKLGTDFPYGTLIVNILGSFLIALVAELSTRVVDFPPNLRLALTTGFMGGFTTYSSFNLETTSLFLDGHELRAVVNVLGTLVACVAAGLLGLVLARRLA